MPNNVKSWAVVFDRDRKICKYCGDLTTLVQKVLIKN